MKNQQDTTPSKSQDLWLLWEYGQGMQLWGIYSSYEIAQGQLAALQTMPPRFPDQEPWFGIEKWPLDSTKLWKHGPATKPETKEGE